ncbi:adenylate/guanylate cyclase domain-containing protein [Rhizobium sp. SL42]|uniref:adenylate/guanylate cyclase domain-containing protein n=1 Tax=Rhizobium sp. SL42 TaxID=2806346 RepID=UPI001F29E5E4|nr:adenylate/guanylate cyclase domain-containing protein [Rhizobium sp. SL42]UJW74233.1 adenylate/guanylate cyclase domain-containing protein [Rhizobium sp. SL42]
MSSDELELIAPGTRGRRSPWRLPVVLWWIARIGTTGYSPRVRRRLAVTNVISAMYSLITIPYILFYMLYDGWGLLPAIIAFAPQVVFYAVTPFFHRFGATAGAVYLCTMWLIFGLASCLFFGRDSGLQFFFLPGAAASILVFGAERLALSGLVALIALCAFLVVEIVLVQPISFLHVEPVFLQVLYYMTVPFTFLLIFTTSFFAFKEAAQAETALETEYRFSERLLQNILPRAVADRLKDHRTQIVADHVDSATILFADIVNFTPRAARWGPQQVVAFLSQIFGRFDAIAMRHGLEKIKTIGDAYMVAGGLPERRADHEAAVALMALDLLACCRAISEEIGEPVEVRIGMDTGPVVAGVIGPNKLLYDVWGDAVNTAARMESLGVASRIQVPDCLKQRLEDRFEFELRGPIEVKGKGQMRVWFLVGAKA